MFKLRQVKFILFLIFVLTFRLSDFGLLAFGFWLLAFGMGFAWDSGLRGVDGLGPFALEICCTGFV